jgi:hypothetical protein
MIAFSHRLVSTLVAGVCAVACASSVPAADQPPASRAYALQGLDVTLSAPVEVAKRKNLRRHELSKDTTGEFLWYPQVGVLPNGDLLAQIRTGGDTWAADLGCPIAFSWSADKGSTWGDLLVTSKHNGYASLVLPSGDLQILPFCLGLTPEGVAGPCNRVPTGKREVQFVDNAIKVTGFLRKTATDLTMDITWKPEEHAFQPSGWGFDGRPVKVKGGWLTTLYGKYEGDLKKKCTLHVAFSKDGMTWEIRGTVVGPESPIGRHHWGNSEAEVCRLPDGRLMCVWRLDDEPYGRSYSSDDGFTWTPADQLPAGVGTVEPRLAVTRGGVVALFGGRPGLHIWLNADGTGGDWQGIDLFKHHNQLAAPNHVRYPGVDVGYAPSLGQNAPAAPQQAYRFDGSSAYGSIVALSDAELLMIYDCFTAEHFGIYVVRATIGSPR